MMRTGKRGESERACIPIFWSSLKPSRRKPRLAMHAWAKRAMASAELLISELVSSFSCVGRASAMPCRMLCGLRGLFAMVLFLSNGL